MRDQTPFDDALRLHQQGHLEEAEAAYEEILAAAPNHAGGLHLLGVIRQQQGRHAEACELIGRAIEADPAKAVYRNNYGAALLSLDRPEEAEASFRRALGIRPKYADAWANLGMAETALGKEAAALESLQKALCFDPRHCDALVRLAALLKKLGRGGEAVAFYERAMAERATAETHFEFGELLFGLGQRDRAIEEYRRTIELAPELAEANFSLANALKDQGKIDEAAGHYRRAVELKPDSAMMHGNLLLCEQYRAGVTPAGLAAAHAEWERRHAAPLRAAWRPFSIDRNPNRPLRLGFVSCNFRQHPVGLFTIRAIEALKGHACEVVCYSDVARGIDFQSVLATRHTDYKSILHSTDCKSIPRKTDWQSVPRPRPDSITERFIAAADRWVEAGEMSDEQLAEQIRNDQIDILFDLGGHLGGNRLLVFARKPAPIQVKWVGYPGSAGLTAMDYLLADRWQVEDGGEAHCPEKVLRLPDGYVCFDPPADAPEVGALPALAHGTGGKSEIPNPKSETNSKSEIQNSKQALTPGPSPAGRRGETKALTPAPLTPCPSPEYGRGETCVTFGSFNNPAKITPCVVAAWAEILRRVPGSRLVLKYQGFDQAGTRRHYEGLFAAGGIAPERLELLGWSPRGRMLEEYNRLDLVLDPFPYSGGITTCEALWMGVPVITLPGKTFAGRHSLSHLSNVGLTETVARDVADYVELAVRLAHDLPRLAKWRAELRGQVARSALCDGPRFAANLMKALRSIWQEWLANAPLMP